MYYQSQDNHKGFTLIELLVVIAIIAVLSVVVILTLNPAEILRQARDSTRISDMATLKSGISLFLADVATTTTGGMGPLGIPTNALGSGSCYYYSGGGFATTSCAWSGAATDTSPGGVPIGGTAIGVASKAVNGSGWIPINFRAISAGAPFGNLPSDPVNSGNFFYSYANGTSTTGFKLGTKMESSKYNSGAGNIQNNDGGVDASTYEAGTLLSQ